MSAPAPRDKEEYGVAFGGINVPCLHMTGTLDDSPIGGTKAKDRRVPFDHIRGADQYLITFTGGDHLIFSGRGRLAGGEKDAHFQNLIRVTTTAFWDAYLKGDRRAMELFKDGGIQRAIGEDGTFEKYAKQS
jgi:hypothetical protein